MVIPYELVANKKSLEISDKKKLTDWASACRTINVIQINSRTKLEIF